MKGRVEMNDKGKKKGDYSSCFLFFFHESPFSMDITMVCHNLVPRVSPLPMEREKGRETLETRLVLL